MQCKIFGDLLPSHSVVFWRIEVVPCINSVFLFIAELFSGIDILPVRGHLCWFQFLAVTDKVVINRILCEHKISFIWDKYPKNIIARSYGNCMACKKLPNCFPEWLYHIHSSQQCMSYKTNIFLPLTSLKSGCILNH